MNINRKLKVTADSSANRKLLKQLEKEGLIEFTYINLENAKLNVSNGARGWDDDNYPAFFTLDVSILDGPDVLGPADTPGLAQGLVSILGGKQQNLNDRRQLLGHFYSGNDIFVTGDKGDILKNKTDLAQIGITVLSNDELKDYIKNLNNKRSDNYPKHDSLTKIKKNT